jgi:hypothetical protein
MFSKNIRKFATIALAGVFALGLSAGAMAETQWNKDHPRRHQVNHRLNNQDKRIHHAVKDGKMNKQQAAQLHKEDHQIRHEERQMASKDGGHITKQDQRQLNRQENQVSNQIRNE